MEADKELSLYSCESDVVDETCSLGGDDAGGISCMIEILLVS